MRGSGRAWRTGLALALLSVLYVGPVVIILAASVIAAVAEVEAGPPLLVPAAIVDAAVIVDVWQLAVIARRVWPLQGCFAVTDTDHPRLWAEARWVADQVEAPRPDEIYLSWLPRIEVRQEIRSGLVRGPLRVVVGIPLLLVSHRELRALLGHELARESARHPWLTRRVHRGAEGLGQMARRLGTRRSVGRRFGWLFDRYVALAAQPLGSHDLVCDQWVADLTSSGTLRSAILRRAELAVAWQTFVTEYVVIGAPLHVRPTGLFAGLSSFLGTRPSFAGEVGALPEPVSPFTFRTSQTERLAALGDPSQDHTQDSGSALSVLGRPEQTLLGAEQLVFAPGYRPVSWAEQARIVGAKDARHGALLLARTAPFPLKLPPHGLTSSDREHLARGIGTVFDILARGRAGELVPGFTADATDDERGQIAGRLVGDLLAAALEQRGTAFFAHDWSGPVWLSSLDGARLDPWSLAASAVSDPMATGALERWCRRHGIEWVRPSST